MDEAGQGIVLSSPPKCGVPVARDGLIDRRAQSRARCFGVVGPYVVEHITVRRHRRALGAEPNGVRGIDRLQNFGLRC